LRAQTKFQYGKSLIDKQINNWIESMAKKWSAFGPKIFENKIHYDSCGDNSILNFLKSLANA